MDGLQSRKKIPKRQQGETDQQEKLKDFVNRNENAGRLCIY